VRVMFRRQHNHVRSILSPKSFMLKGLEVLNVSGCWSEYTLEERADAVEGTPQTARAERRDGKLMWEGDSINSDMFGRRQAQRERAEILRKSNFISKPILQYCIITLLHQHEPPKTPRSSHSNHSENQCSLIITISHSKKPQYPNQTCSISPSLKYRDRCRTCTIRSSRK
jgi:hypothetical protein